MIGVRMGLRGYRKKKVNQSSVSINLLTALMYKELMDKNITQFANQNYLNLETFRKNGDGVKTPVWFVQDDENLYIWTSAESGKAKRIRNSGTVKIAPSKADGTVVGEWLVAAASVDDSERALQRIKALMRKKYGLSFDLFAFIGKLQRAKYASVKVEILSKN